MEKYNDTQIAANHIKSYFVMGAVIPYAVSYSYDKKYSFIGS